MTLYLGSGFRCQASGACGFRVLPASGDDCDLDEAARVRRSHERACRFKAIAEPMKTKAHSLDDVRTELATQRLELEDPSPRPRVMPTYRRGPRTSTAYVREPSGRGWKIVVAEYATKHPETTAREVAVGVGCRVTTAATYLGMFREGRRRRVS